MRLVVAIAVVTAAPGGDSPAPTANRPPRQLTRYDFTALTPVLQKLIDDKAASGFTVVVVKDGAVVYEKAFGTFTLDSVVPIASSTKMPTTVAVLTLVDQGKIALDDPVGKHLPDWPADKAG